MNIVLGFLPFIVFAISSTTHGPLYGLVAGTITAAVMLVRNVGKGRGLKILDVGSLVLFAALAAYEYLGGGDLSLFAVRFWTDIGLFIIVLLSVLVGSPFSEQYARDTVDPQYWSRPEFHRKNMVISSFWAGAFMVMAVIEYFVAYTTAVSATAGTVGVLATMLVSVGFTKWFSQRR